MPQIISMGVFGGGGAFLLKGRPPRILLRGAAFFLNDVFLCVVFIAPFYQVITITQALSFLKIM